MSHRNNSCNLQGPSLLPKRDGKGRAMRSPSAGLLFGLQQEFGEKGKTNTVSGDLRSASEDRKRK